MAFLRYQSSFKFFFILLTVFSVLVLPIKGETSIADHNNGVQIHVEKICTALSKAGYYAMSPTLQVALPTLISSNTINTSSLTIFAPPDQLFLSNMKYYRQPPLTLLEYQVAPMKLDMESLLSPASPLIGSKIETFLPGHPLVTTLHHGEASINGVEIKKWNIYNDGNVIVHGVAAFFILLIKPYCIHRLTTVQPEAQVKILEMAIGSSSRLKVN